MTRRYWAFLFALVFVLSSGLIVLNRPVAAQSAGCSAVSSLSGIYDFMDSRNITGNFVAGETISASAVGDPSGLPMPITLNVNGNFTNPYVIPSNGSYTVTVSNGPDAVIATVSCSAGGGQNPGTNPSWSGYADGRLNPDPAEYYSLWCSGGNLAVYRALNGQGVLLASFPLGEIQALVVGGQSAAFDSAGGMMTLWRADQDAFVLSGSNGNNAPNEGSKSFSLSQCLARNGGPVATATNTPVPRPPDTAVPTITPSFTASSTAVPTITPSFTASSTASPTITPSLTATATTRPTNTRTPRPTRTPTMTRTASPTKVPSDTPTPSETPLMRMTATRIGQPARPSATPTLTPTAAGTPLVAHLATFLTSPNDTDGDGVRDGYDFCKYEPGTAQGCPDPDGDGVGGPLDFCPDSVGTTGTFGCGDADGDGLHDGRDLCPNGVGTAKAYGCPDNDDDGVPNAIDWCPMQTVVPGTPQFQGCNDPDGDGFVNGARVPTEFRDDCPAASRSDYPNGCPPAISTMPTLDFAALLNEYSNEQEGQFTTLILSGVATPPPNCRMNSWGFCMND